MDAIRYRAAGGVVCDGEQVLVLRRPSRDEIRLPKGHIEADESAREAAEREVIEETGYADLEIAADLGRQTVEFDYAGAHIVREERYYLMHLRGTRQVARRRKDQQFIPTWMDWEEALSALSYSAEREWLRRAQAVVGSSKSERTN